MPTHVLLLRGVNVGGARKLPMVLLRSILEELGHTEVATYIQSGNAVFTPDAGGVRGARARPGLRALAVQVEDALELAVGFRPVVVVVEAAGLRAVVERNPFPEVAEPKQLHAGFFPGRLGPGYLAGAADAQLRAGERGSRDRVQVDPDVDPDPDPDPAGHWSVVYLATPDGLGRSVLVELLGRVKDGDLRPWGTFRNWATVTRLVSMVDD